VTKGAGARRPPAWPALLAFAAAFVFTLVANTILIVAVGAARTGAFSSRAADEAQRYALSGPGLAAQAALSASVFACLALAVARIVDPSGRARSGEANAGWTAVAMRLRLGASRATTAGILAAVAGMLGLSLACGAVADLLSVRSSGAVMGAIAHEMRASSPAKLALATAAIGVAPGVAEEIFFRGLVQGRLVAAWGSAGGIVGAALAFGLTHVEPAHAALAFVAGLFLGWTAERLGGIRPTMLAHSVNNSAFVLLAAVSSAASRRAEVAAAVGGAVVWALATAVLASPRARRP
jgi:membrane protease YdiL (CAAX protease family)